MEKIDQTLNDLKKFTHSFFTNLGCLITEVGDTLLVSKIPVDFEQAYSKKGPYTLVFDKDDSEGELVSRGSFMLKTMTSYLEQRGQTALVKLMFDQDYLAAFKRSFSFKKCELLSLTKTPSYKVISIFSFSTTLQYLNEKEQVMNTLAVHEGAIVPFSVDQYTYQQGDPRDVSLERVKEEYLIAKEAMKKKIEPRIAEVSQVLDAKMAQETVRIHDHYTNQLKEKDQTLIKLKEQLSSSEKTPASSPAALQRRDRIIENIKLLENPDFEARVIQERDFVVRDEEFKHALNISNKLVSTTFAYYPIFSFNLALKNAQTARTVTIKYNPLKNEFETPLCCEQCKSTLQEVFLCGSAHILCANCFDTCRSCEQGMCSLCMKKTCTQCARRLCKRCVSRCTLCWKDACKSHIRTNYASGKEGCTSCLKACTKCGMFADKQHLIQQTEGEICLKCNNLSSILRPR